MRLQRRRFSEADEVRTFPYGTVQVVEIGDVVVGRMEYRPGWRWSVDVKPNVGTEWCDHHHVILTFAGRCRASMSDGAERWRDLVGEHHRQSAEAIERHRGRYVKSTGDGVLGSFDGAERAVRAAAAIRNASIQLGIAIRAGVHSGEVEMASDDVRGLAVHTAARVMSVAGPNEVLVSATVRDLLDGSDLAFEDVGRHELKGLHGERQLYRLV